MTDIQIISRKYQTVDSFLGDFEQNSIILKENVQRILRSNGIVSDNFDDYYNSGLRKLQKTLKNKRYLSGIKRVFSYENVENAVKLIVQRLVSYTRNELNAERPNSIHRDIVNYNRNEYLNQTEEQENQDLIIEDLRRISARHPKKMEIVLEDSGFNHDEIRDLCLKIGINFSNLDLENKIETKKEKLENSLVQLLMVF